MASRASYAEGAAFAGLSFGSTALVGLVGSVVVARVYGIEPIGEYAIALAAPLALATLSQTREQTALVRELALLSPRDPRITGLFAAVMTFSLGLTIAVAVPVTFVTWLVLSGPVHHRELFLPAAVLIAGYVAIDNTTWNLDAVFSSFRAGRQLFAIRLVQGISYICLALAFSQLIGETVWGLVAATVGAPLAGLVHRWASVRQFMRLRVPRRELKAGFRSLPELIRFGLKVAPGAIADGVGRQSTVWVLSATVSTAAVGAYNRAWMLATRLIELGHRVAEVLFPTLVERRAAGDSAGFDRASIDSIRYTIAGMLLPAAAAGGAAHGVMQVFGPGFDRGADALAILVVVPALAAVEGIQNTILWTDGRPWLSTIVTSARAAATIGLTVVLAADNGITGAALAMLVAYVLEVTWLFLVVRGHWSTSVRGLWPYRTMLALGLAYAAAFGLSRELDSALPGAGGTAVALVAGTAAYGLVAVGAGILVERDRERVAAIRARWRPRSLR